LVIAAWFVDWIRCLNRFVSEHNIIMSSPTVVQRFAGISIANREKMDAAASRIVAAHHQRRRVVAVVSARGAATDELITLGKQVHPNPPARELDMILATAEQASSALTAMKIHALGVPAVSLNGGQAGVLTNSAHTHAQIRAVTPLRIQQALDAGRVVVVAGCQGVDQCGEITTLGRGGSIRTALALAAVLGANACEIYTDVDGIPASEPRGRCESRPIGVIDYDEMMDLANSGSVALPPTAIDFAKMYNVPIHLRSWFSDGPGTWIVAEGDTRRIAV
jgi:aspartate kinase